MQIKRAFLTVILSFFSVLIFAAEPYATITYAEGTAFKIIRNNKATSWQITSPEVFGMTIERGDLIITESGTFLEIRIHPISASLQIAENTSFRCDADEDGTKSSGELLYGRVRAKVAKLSATSTYRISSPSLVAGVRGTDFGLDLIAVRPAAAKTGTAGTGTTTPILNRVFCFEGSVAVSDTVSGADQSEIQPVLIERNEMVEKVVTTPAAATDGNAAAPDTVKVAVGLQKKALSEEVTVFWKPHPLSPDLIPLAGGTFIMGSPVGERFRNQDEAAREVTVEAFTMNRYETTQAEWNAVMGANPSIYKSPAQPVENVNWYEILVYCNKRSVKDGLRPCYSLAGQTDPDSWGKIPAVNDDKWNGIECDFTANGYRLPTESEWEYACRAGSSTTFNTGDNINTLQSNYNGQFHNNRNLEGENRGMPLMVGVFKSNAFGLYDMHGNVAEWCWDTYDGSDNGAFRVIRGGGWNNYGHLLRSACRQKSHPEIRNSAVGFRIVFRQ